MKKGFTLVELLAVIAILAILVIIALPNVLKLFNEAKKQTFLTEAKTIYKEATKKYITESVKGNIVRNISSSGDNKLNLSGEQLDYCLTLNSKGKVTSMKVSNGNYYIEYNGSKIEDLNVDGIKEGTIDTTTCRVNRETPVNNCTFDGELVQGAEYINGQYTYRYKQQGTYSSWENINEDGWGVKLTDKDSTDEVTTPLCTSINNKSIVSMSYMFLYSQATELDLSSFNTSNVTNMDHMFAYSQATTLDLSSFDTSNVTNMSYMFNASKATTFDLSSFNTSNVTDMSQMFWYSQATTLDLSSFDTSSVTNMYGMFNGSKATTLDLSSFDTSNVRDMFWMFNYSQAITIYVSNKWNTSNVTSVTSSNYMFHATTNLVGGAGTRYSDSNPKDKTYARVDGGTSNPGYFTLKTN